MKKFHDALKTIYDPKCSGATTLLSAGGSMEALFLQVKRQSWKCGQTTSIVCSVDHQLSMRMQSTDFHRSLGCNVLFDEFPTVMETRKAVQQLSSGKAPCEAAIPAEVYKYVTTTEGSLSYQLLGKYW